VDRPPPAPRPLDAPAAHSLTRTQTGHVPAVIAVVLIVVVALAVLSFTVHVLFSPWLLAAIAIVAWIKFRPRRSRQ
jgi:hypothetical protein